MKRVEKALSTFRNPHTCAQAVYSAFNGDDVEKMNEMKQLSGGRAPENMCGALYAAKESVSSDFQASLENDFLAETGATECLKLKGTFKVPCPDCVRIASELVVKYKG